MATDIATHNDAGLALVTIDDMTKSLNETLDPKDWADSTTNMGVENPVLMANIMAMMSASKNDEMTAGYIRGFMHCYMALRNAEERCRKERP